jgi:CRP-like cAMP-binding protein
MLDELRRDLQRRLEDLLGEADKLRHALTALGSDGQTTGSSASAVARSRRSTTTPTSRRPARARHSPKSASSPTAETRATSQATPTRRAASGGTKNAVLTALAGGDAMTASEVANATGLGRASVSTTLSKLAKSGEVAKAARGYQLAAQSSTKAPEST